MSSAETVVDYELVEHLVERLEALDPELRIEGVRTADIVSMLEELLRHRDLEEEEFWGMGDE